MLDLFRSVAFHRLEFDDRVFVFGTNDAKLALDGVQKMLSYIERQGLSWGTQLFFSDRTVVRDPRVDYAWLSTTGPQILTTAEAIRRRPFHRFRAIARREMPRAGRLLPYDTIRVLRRAPALLLERSDDGPLVVDGEAYAPRVVVSSRASQSTHTVGNRRATWLLQECGHLARTLRRQLSGARRQTVTAIGLECDEMARQLPFSQFGLADLRLPATPSEEELVDPRYQSIFEGYEELLGLGWHPGMEVASTFAYVKYADEIYQAFVALVLARALNAPMKFPALEPYRHGPSFSSDMYDIYYDTMPPSEIFKNWRDASIRPAEMRPDVTVVDRARGAGLLLDAKYRVEANGQLPAEALHDAQVYMQSFDLRRLVIVYPGHDLGVRQVSGGGHTIFEISVSPLPDLENYLRETVRPLLEETLEVLSP
jgi:hypothetical protein